MMADTNHPNINLDSMFPYVSMPIDSCCLCNPINFTEHELIPIRGNIYAFDRVFSNIGDVVLINQNISLALYDTVNTANCYQYKEMHLPILAQIQTNRFM